MHLLFEDNYTALTANGDFLETRTNSEFLLDIAIDIAIEDETPQP